MAIREKHEISSTASLILPDNTNVWQIRFKDDRSGKWCTRSSKHKNLMQAHLIANEIIKSCIPTVKAVFDQWYALQPKSRKLTDYDAVMINWTFPYIGHHRVNELSQSVINEFNQERSSDFINKHNKLPSKSTLLCWNAALNAVLDHAIQGDIIHHTEAPKLTTKYGETAKRREAFTERHINQIFDSQFWTIPTPRSLSKDLRNLLRVYCYMLLGTGIRHGTESENITYQDVQIINTKGQVPHLEIKIRKGKTTLHTGDRIVVVKDDAAAHVKELFTYAKAPHYKLLSVASGPIKPLRLAAVFKQLLQYEQIDSKQFSLYSFRHTYITNQLLNGTEPALIAAQCGTSIEMIDRHYSHLKARQGASKLRG